MIEAATTPLAIVVSTVGLLAGLVLAFSGYRLARSVATFAGFLAGFAIGWGLGPAVAEPLGLAPLAGAIVAALGLGVALAIVFRFAFRFAGGVVGVLAGMAVATNLAWAAWALVLAAVVGGVVGVVLNKIAIVSFTAIGGASLAVKSAAELFYGFSGYVLTMEAASILGATIAIALTGILSQMRSLRGEDGVPFVGESTS